MMTKMGSFLKRHPNPKSKNLIQLFFFFVGNRVLAVLPHSVKETLKSNLSDDLMFK